MIALCLRKKLLTLASRSLLPAVAIAMFVISPPASVAQSLPEIPIIYDFGIGARAMGMGQAHVAVCEDASAMFHNPAGLAQVRRIELSAGFTHLSEDLDVTEFGRTVTSTLGSTQLSSLGLAYPFPTYRGSLVMGFAYNRTRNMDSDYMRYGFNPYYELPEGTAAGWEKEQIFERGGISNYTVAFGLDVSPEVAVGASFSYLNGKSERTFGRTAVWQIDASSIPEEYLKVDDADISGWTASLGTIAKLGNVARLGLTVKLPEHITLDGAEFIDEYDPDIDEYLHEEFLFEDEIILPLSFTAGASAAPVPGLIFAVDARYTDWKQIDYAGPIRVDNFYAYGATTSLRFGTEFMFPFAPLRIRGGFFTEPLAFKLLPDISNSGEIKIAQIDEDGKFYTLGAGLLLAESFTIDLAWVHGGFERSIPNYSEKKTIDKIFVTAGYRF
ncbi:MAG: hypothetical protein V2A71_00655 [Candidatus Eisenbacteria bacterium]